MFLQNIGLNSFHFLMDNYLNQVSMKVRKLEKLFDLVPYTKSWLEDESCDLPLGEGANTK